MQLCLRDPTVSRFNTTVTCDRRTDRQTDIVVVNFLLALIELFSLALTVEALWANIGRNCAVWKGVGHFKRKFQEEGVVHQRILA